jgi:Zn-dependent protease with chaperone function
MRFWSYAALAAMLMLCTVVYGQHSTRNPKTEKEIVNKLAAIAPASVDAFQRATSAMDQGDYPQAVQLYQEVLQQVSTFTPAMRRLGACLAGSGQIDEGITYSRRALKLERSPENLASLAQILAYPAPDKQGTPQQMQEALGFARQASDTYSGPEDYSYIALFAGLALTNRSQADFRRATESLVSRHPEQMATHYFNGIRLAMDEDWVGSQNEINTAKRLGLPPETAEALLSSGIRRRAIAWRVLHYGPFVILAWAGGLVILFVLGKLFSVLTLRLIETADPASPISSKHVLLRRCYRQLINVAGSYYYISLPVVIVIVLGVAGGIVYGVLMLGYIPIKLVALLVIGAIVTVYKMVQTLFVRVDDTQPGRSLRREDAPDLWNLTREVADKLNTRPLDRIRVTPGTEMAVYERGSRSERRRDEAQRTLLMGMGLLPGFSQNSFRAILAHEYGHLSHRDTAGGDVALRVNRDMINSAYALARSRQAVPWNIGFQFLQLYHFLFRRISHGATRLQEVLADRAAAGVYGAQAFEEGLRHVVRRQIEFVYIARTEFKEAQGAGRPFRNLYTLHVHGENSVEEAVDKALNRQTSEDDTHPSPADRFRFVERVPCTNPQRPDGAMWDLFRDPDALTREMSSQIEYEVRGDLALRAAALPKARSTA